MLLHDYAHSFRGNNVSQGYGGPVYHAHTNGEPDPDTIAGRHSWLLPDPHRMSGPTSAPVSGFPSRDPGGAWTGHDASPTRAGRFDPASHPPPRATGTEATGRHPADGATHPTYPTHPHQDTRPGHHLPGSAKPEPPGGAPAETHEAIAARSHGSVINRLQYMNSLHALHAWERRRSGPIGPHALAFVYAAADLRSLGPRPYYEARVGKRLFKAGEDVEDLVGLLYQMVDIADGYLDNGGIFDPLAQMTQRDDEVPADAIYIGLGVSSLDTPAGRWKEMQTHTRSGMAIPGRCMMLLVDRTSILADRPAQMHDPLQVRSNRPLGMDASVKYHVWRPLVIEDQDLPTWQWLEQLHQRVVEGQRRMHPARTSRPGRR
jgi:hypothetical protein